jgi:hypothetical protein
MVIIIHNMDKTEVEVLGNFQGTLWHYTKVSEKK